MIVIYFIDLSNDVASKGILLPNVITISYSSKPVHPLNILATFVKPLVLKLVNFSDLIFEFPLNIRSASVKAGVVQLERSPGVSKELHPSNIPYIEFTLDTSHFDKSKVFNALSSLNVPLILVTLLVSQYSIPLIEVNS